MLQSGDKVSVEISIEKIGDTSVVFLYKVMHGDVLAATAKTVSVAVDKKTQEKRPVPQDWRLKFNKA
jgi:acyl-CoA thioesterase FadM